MRFTVILLILISSLKAYSADNISINENSIILSKEGGDNLIIDISNLKSKHQGKNIKPRPPKAIKLGNCLLIEYGRAWHDVQSSAREITLPGNIYLYSIPEEKRVAEINSLSISEFLETSHSGTREKSALILGINERFIEKQYEVNGDCAYQKINAIPDMEVYSAFSRNGTVYIQGYCSRDNPQCLVVHNSRGTTVYGVYNKARQ